MSKHEKVILVRIETSPEDVGGMHVAEGILTTKGGMTSHAAVVARGMGTCCVAGCGSIQIDYEKEEFTVGEKTIRKGEYISLDGTRGEVILGQVPTVEPTLSGDFSKLMKWTDEIRRLKIRTNADTPEDAKRARDFGAEGIGLCRTEHMFFGENRIDYVRQMILTAGNVAHLKTAVHEVQAELGQAPKKKQSSLIHRTKNIKVKLKESERLYKGALNKCCPCKEAILQRFLRS